MLFKHLRNIRLSSPDSFRKLSMIMRITGILLLTSFLQCSAAGYAQNKISLAVRDMPLEKVFLLIEKQTDYAFFVDHDLIQYITVTINVKTANIDEVLNQCLRDQPLLFTIIDRTIIIKRKESGYKNKMEPSPALNPLEIHGHVKDSQGNPLAGASVIIKGTKQIAITDINGDFNFKQVDANAILIISSIGYSTVVHNINGKEPIEIEMNLTSTTLLDVIVNKGYYSTLQRFNTGDVSTIEKKEIDEQPVSNPLAALEGRMPGLYIQQVTGVPGGSFNVQLRGQNSIANGNNPLYIIDGIPFTSSFLGATFSNLATGLGNPLSSINPSDIEKIEVLKDADATSIYGSRGANGVILITTTKGRAGTVKENISTYEGYGKATHLMKLLNSQEYLQMRNEAFANDGQVPGIYDYDVNGTWDSTKTTDWQKMLIGGTAHLTDAQGSIEGGNLNTQFTASLGYHRETTIFPGDFNYKKISAHFSLSNISTNKKLHTILSASYSVDNNILPYNDPTNAALTLPPVAPSPLDSFGRINWGPLNSFYGNPLATLLQKYKATTDNLITNLQMSYDLFKGMAIKVNTGYTQVEINQNITSPLTSFNPSYGYSSGNSSFGEKSVKTWVVEPQLSYERNISKGVFSVLLGTTYQQDLIVGNELYANGFPSDALLSNIAAASSLSVLNSTYSQYRYNAFFGRFSYNWNNEYILNITGRRDGSSRFGPDKQFSNFGAIGAAWIFTENKSIKRDLNFLSFGKLRASYGTSGNDQIGDYGFLDLWNSTVYPYQGTSGLYPTRLFNSNFGWENNTKIEGGIELGFHQDQVRINASYYRNRSSNQLLGYSLPPTTGFATINGNLPATVENTGWESMLAVEVVKTKIFSWTATINLTIPINKLVAFPNLASSSYATVYEIGKPLTIVKAFHYTGIDPQTGVYQFTDVDKDGSITYPNDLLALKQTGQKYYGGIDNSLRFKNISLDFLFQYVKQQGRNYLYGSYYAPGMMSNQPSLVLNRWQNSSSRADVQKYTQDYGSAAYQAFTNTAYFGDNTVSDASFVRLKNVSLSYDLPDKWIKKLNLEKLRAYIKGENLLTITHYQGVDPENQQIYYSPLLKIVTVGIQIIF
jgi:TonB-linked SusC/RagA family outer membrane protein